MGGGRASPAFARAQDVLALSDEHERASYLAGVKGRPLLQQTVVTCLDSIQRDKEGDKEVRLCVCENAGWEGPPPRAPARAQLSSLVIGTEARQLHLLDAAGGGIELTIDLPSVPTHLAVSGLLHVDYRINVACRDGVVYAVKASAAAPDPPPPHYIHRTPAPPLRRAASSWRRASSAARCLWAWCARTGR